MSFSIKRDTITRLVPLLNSSFMRISRRELGALALGSLAMRGRALPIRPKLLVLVLLEQLRGDSLDNVSSQLAPGGLRRLLEKGAYFPDCRHLASTFPASSVATLATGAWPSQHGIVAGIWYDRSARKAVPASDEALLATTITAQVAADETHHAYVISLDPTLGGIFAGTSAAKRYWIDDSGQIAASGEPPDWLPKFNFEHPIETQHDKKWQAIGARADAPPLRTLTYTPDHPQEFMTLFRSSPFAQELQLDLATELIKSEGLGKDHSDLVCVLLSSSALLGYEQGAQSVLLSQMLLSLDRRIEVLLGDLAKSHGENGFTMVLAGAHGAPPRPAAEVRNLRLVDGENLAQSVDRNLAAQSMGRVERYLYPFLYLDTTGFRDPEPVRMQAARAAMQYKAVADYYTAGGACSTHDDWERRFRNSFHLTRSGDLMVSYRPEYIEEYGQGRGISYGSLYNYDVRVPLCFYGPQFRAGTYEAPVESVDLAPTLARVMGVEEPSSSVGHVLAEALAT
jgi:Type I phosphodiesterase / nucleotide pyrophosphatase